MNNEQLFEQTKHGNNAMLSSSKQLGFLAAALIASAELWTNANTNNLIITKVTILLLILSIALSAITHFIVGYVYMREIERILNNPRAKAFRIKTAIIMGLLQALFLFVSLGFVGYIYVFI